MDFNFHERKIKISVQLKIIYKSLHFAKNLQVVNVLTNCSHSNLVLVGGRPVVVVVMLDDSH